VEIAPQLLLERLWRFIVGAVFRQQVPERCHIESTEQADQVGSGAVGVDELTYDARQVDHGQQEYLAQLDHVGLFCRG
jgi:hypothetical protein